MNTVHNKRGVHKITRYATNRDMSFESGVVIKTGTVLMGVNGNKNARAGKNGARVTEIRTYANHVLDDEKQWHGKWEHNIHFTYDAPNLMYDAYHKQTLIYVGHANRTYRNISDASYARLQRVLKTRGHHTTNNPYPIWSRWMAR